MCDDLSVTTCSLFEGSDMLQAQIYFLKMLDFVFYCFPSLQVVADLVFKIFVNSALNIPPVQRTQIQSDFSKWHRSSEAPTTARAHEDL